MQAAKPLYDVDDFVAYRDRQGRLQRGEVMAVEASWRGRPDREPLIVYTLRHPTYAGRRFYTTDEVIIGLSNIRPDALDTVEAAHV